MSLRPIKIAVQYLLGACAIAFFVGLLTFIFSFLGTIFCAALAGMMLGAFRNLRWHALLFSFLFPAVIVFIMRVSKTEIPARHIVFLAFACYGMFWMSYAGARTLLVFERKGPAVSGERLERPLGPAGINGSARASHGNGAVVRACEPAVSTLRLALLQGRWLRETAMERGREEARVLELRGEELVVRMAGPGGGVNLVARCRLKLEENGNGPILKLASEAKLEDDFLISI